jgi:anti-sigma factor RsiW
MTSSDERDCLSYKGLLPLYVKGLLPPDQAAAVESALDACPELRAELEDWKAIGEAYREVEACLPAPAPGAFARVMSKIEKPQRLGFLQWLGLRPAFSLAVIAAQIIVLVGFGVYTAKLRSHFETLSVPTPVSREQIRLNVVFRPDATEQVIREALRKIDGRIIDGPRTSGLYLIGVGSSSNPEAAMAALRSSGVVVMAERAY